MTRAQVALLVCALVAVSVAVQAGNVAYSGRPARVTDRAWDAYVIALPIAVGLSVWWLCIAIHLAVRSERRALLVSVDPLRCRSCGYDLDGLPVGTRGCPECSARLYPSYGDPPLPESMRLKRGMPVSAPPLWAAPRRRLARRHLASLILAAVAMVVMAFAHWLSASGLDVGLGRVAVWAFLVFVLSLLWGGGWGIAQAIKTERLTVMSKRDPRRCRSCDYLLNGLPVGTAACPECGARLYPYHGPREGARA